MSRLIKHLHEPAESCTDSQTGWDDDFDDDDDENGYESPYSGYESPYSGEEGGGGDEESTDKDYEPPPKEPHDLSHHLSLKLPTRDNGVYFGSRSNDPPPPIVCPRPPVSPRMPEKRSRRDPPPPPHGGRPSGNFPPGPPQVFREKKPGRKPASTLPTHRGVPPGSGSTGLDPCWYVGEVTRGQAESCLQRLNKDGAYLVRDSTRQRANQPFTLVVFYQGKVFNIQIRQENQQFLLGTGFKVHESFPSVNSIIHHYSQSPLLLIDAKKRRSRQQNQCLLSDPAGFYMARQNWS